MSTAVAQLPRSDKRVPGLDGLRGVAIIAVFFFHYGGGASSTNFLVHALGNVKQAGWIGVDVFFVLSGFLITGILYDSRGEPGYLRNFYIRRALRLFPLFYGLLALLFLISPLIGAEWQKGHIAYLLYSANVASYVNANLNGPSSYITLTHIWSLAAEEQFYLVWPFVVLLASERRTLMRICIGVIAVAFLLRVGLALSGAVTPSFLYMETPCRMDTLAAGGLIALVLRGPGATIPRHLPGLLFAGGLLVFGAAAVAAHHPLNSSYWMGTIGFSGVAMIGCGLLLATLMEGSAVNRLMSLSWLQRIGRYSYGLYLFQGLLWPTFWMLFLFLHRVMHSQAAAALAYLAVAFAVTLLMSAVSFEFFERPITRYKRRWASKPGSLSLAELDAGVSR